MKVNSYRFSRRKCFNI